VQLYLVHVKTVAKTVKRDGVMKINREILDECNSIIAPAPSFSRIVEWQEDRDVWFNPREGSDYSPTQYCPCSSLKQNNNIYLYVIDLDSPGKWNMLHAARDIYNFSLTPPIVKFSGVKGLHLIWHIEPSDADEYSTMIFLKQQTQKMYDHLNLQKYGLTIGRSKNVDLSVYKRNGIVRLCGARGNGRYSVPINIDDRISTIFQKSIGQVDIDIPSEPEVLLMDVPKIETKKFIPKKPAGITQPFLEVMLLDKLPDHDMYWALTVFLRFEKGLEPIKIFEYFKKNARWFPVGINNREENRIIERISATVGWADRIASTGENPCPRWLYRREYNDRDRI